MAVVGLLKFFREEAILDSFIDGMFWCNTPEFYRLSTEKGVGDLNESCSISYRSARGDAAIKLEIEGKEIQEITSLTMHSSQAKDKWLHCWFIFEIPINDAETKQLVSEINRMRVEFGNNYAFIAGKDISELARRVQSETEHKVDYGRVTYSGNQMEWNYSCKSLKYKYQREFRFVVGNCHHHDVNPLKVLSSVTFRDIVQKNPVIDFRDKETGELLFYMDLKACRTSLI